MIIRATEGKFKDETIRLKLEGTMLLEEPLEMSKEELIKIISRAVQPEAIMENLEITAINDDDIGVSVEVVVDLNSPISLGADILGRKDKHVFASKR